MWSFYLSIFIYLFLPREVLPFELIFEPNAFCFFWFLTSPGSVNQWKNALAKELEEDLRTATADGAAKALEPPEGAAAASWKNLTKFGWVWEKSKGSKQF